MNTKGVLIPVEAEEALSIKDGRTILTITPNPGYKLGHDGLTVDITDHKDATATLHYETNRENIFDMPEGTREIKACSVKLPATIRVGSTTYELADIQAEVSEASLRIAHRFTPGRLRVRIQGLFLRDTKRINHHELGLFRFYSQNSKVYANFELDIEQVSMCWVLHVEPNTYAKRIRLRGCHIGAAVTTEADIGIGNIVPNNTTIREALPDIEMDERMDENDKDIILKAMNL